MDYSFSELHSGFLIHGIELLILYEFISMLEADTTVACLLITILFILDGVFKYFRKPCPIIIQCEFHQRHEIAE